MFSGSLVIQVLGGIDMESNGFLTISTNNHLNRNPCTHDSLSGVFKSTNFISVA